LAKPSNKSVRVLIGTSGWVYKDWAERFYPSSLKDSDKLAYYSEHFKTVEINNSFYRLPSEDNFLDWAKKVPEDFVFAVKLSRFLTHIKRLKVDNDTNTSVDRFCSHVSCLKAKLGPILVQLPSSLAASEQKIDNLATQFKRADSKYKMQFKVALECRHDSWFSDNILEQLKSHNIAIVINSSPKTSWPYTCTVTADFSYIRFHGSKRLYSSSYSNNELDRWSEFINSDLKECKTVYCYFNNDKSARAVENAKYLGPHI